MIEQTIKNLSRRAEFVLVATICFATPVAASIYGLFSWQPVIEISTSSEILNLVL